LVKDIIKPYYQIKLFNYILRFFPNKNPRDLFWHRDKYDRRISLLYGDVELQYDNDIPFKMDLFDSYFIMSEEYHRVISDKPFLILIKEYK